MFLTCPWRLQLWTKILHGICSGSDNYKGFTWPVPWRQSALITPALVNNHDTSFLEGVTVKNSGPQGQPPSPTYLLSYSPGISIQRPLSECPKTACSSTIKRTYFELIATIAASEVGHGSLENSVLYIFCISFLESQVCHQNFFQWILQWFCGNQILDLESLLP